jgi:hypothetical protein
VKRRWKILLKGLAGLGPGRRINCRDIAANIIEDIRTKDERYVPWIGKRTTAVRTGANQYINIVDYYRNNF